MATVLQGGNLDIGLKYLDEMHRRRAEELQAQQLQQQALASMSNHFADNRQVAQRAFGSMLGGGGGGMSSRDRRDKLAQQDFENGLAQQGLDLKRQSLGSEDRRADNAQNWQQQTFNIGREDRQRALAEDAMRWGADRADKKEYQTASLQDRQQALDRQDLQYQESVRRQDMNDKRMTAQDAAANEDRDLNRQMRREVLGDKAKADSAKRSGVDIDRQAASKLTTARTLHGQANRVDPDTADEILAAINSIEQKRAIAKQALDAGEAADLDFTDEDAIISNAQKRIAEKRGEVDKKKADSKQATEALAGGEKVSKVFDALKGDAVGIAEAKLAKMPLSDLERRQVLNMLPINRLSERSRAPVGGGPRTPMERVKYIQQEAAADRTIDPGDLSMLLAEIQGDVANQKAAAAARPSALGYAVSHPMDALKTMGRVGVGSVTGGLSELLPAARGYYSRGARGPRDLEWWERR